MWHILLIRCVDDEGIVLDEADTYEEARAKKAYWIKAMAGAGGAVCITGGMA